MNRSQLRCSSYQGSQHKPFKLTNFCTLGKQGPSSVNDAHVVQAKTVYQNKYNGKT